MQVKCRLAYDWFGAGAGGAAKCLTLRTTEPLIPDHHANVTIESRILQLEGHLLRPPLTTGALSFLYNQGTRGLEA